MWQIIKVHIYSKLEDSLFNKLFLRGHFVSKRIRLRIVRLMKWFGNYGFLTIVLLGVFGGVAHFLIAKQWIQVKSLLGNTFLIAVVSAVLGYLLKFLPTRFSLRGRVMQYDDAKEINRYGQPYLYQYYVLNVSNPTTKTLILDKIYLVKGLFNNGYDVVFVNSDEKQPRPEYIDDSWYPDVPADQAILLSGQSMLIKFAAYNRFRYAYIQDSDAKLHKVELVGKDYRAEYDYARRAVFTTNHEQRQAVREMNWIEDENL